MDNNGWLNLCVSELRSCVNVEVAVLGSPSPILLAVCVDAKQNSTLTGTIRSQELCESRRGRPRLPVPSSPSGLCGRKATLNSNSASGPGMDSNAWLDLCV